MEKFMLNIKKKLRETARMNIINLASRRDSRKSRKRWDKEKDDDHDEETIIKIIIHEHNEEGEKVLAWWNWSRRWDRTARRGINANCC